MSEANDYEKRKQELELQKLELEIEQLKHGTKGSHKMERSDKIKFISIIGAVVVPLLIGMGTMFVQLRSQISEIDLDKIKEERETIKEERKKEDKLAKLAVELESDDLEIRKITARNMKSYGIGALPYLTDALKNTKSEVVDEIFSSILFILGKQPDYVSVYLKDILYKGIEKDIKKAMRALEMGEHYSFNLNNNDLVVQIAEQFEDQRNSAIQTLHRLQYVHDQMGMRYSWDSEEQETLQKGITRLREGLNRLGYND